MRTWRKPHRSWEMHSSRHETPSWITPAEAAFLTGRSIEEVLRLVQEHKLRSSQLRKDTKEPAFLLIRTQDLSRVGILELHTPQVHEQAFAQSFPVRPALPFRRRIAALAPIAALVLIASLSATSLGSVATTLFASSATSALLQPGPSHAPRTPSDRQKRAPSRGRSPSVAPSFPIQGRRETRSNSPSPSGTSSPSARPSPIVLPAPSDSQSAGGTPSPSPSPPPSPPPSSCTGVAVAPGEFTQTLVSGRPPGTTFCIKTGTHYLPSPIMSKRDDTFVCEQGAVLDGRNQVVPAIFGYSGYQDRVTVRECTFQRFRPDGSGDGPSASALKTGTGWLIENCDIRDNANGIALFGSTARGNHVHHNDRYALSGTGRLIEGNEIDHNGKSTKIVHSLSDPATFRTNYVHENGGPGLYCDYDNACTFEFNRVENNAKTGIMFEYNISGGMGIIRFNTLMNNGTDLLGQSIYYGANINVRESSNTEVYGNAVIDTIGWHGIVVVDDGRSGPISNNSVHDNTMNKSIISGVASGAAGRTLSPSTVHYDRNSYFVPNKTGPFWQWGTAKTWDQWRALGLDPYGSRELM